jgi:hypothetical protein
MPTKNIFSSEFFFAYYFLKVHLHHSSKIVSHKQVEIKVILTTLLDDRRLQIRTSTNGSGTLLKTGLFVMFFSYLNPSVAEAMEVEAEQVDQHP